MCINIQFLIEYFRVFTKISNMIHIKISSAHFETKLLAQVSSKMYITD